MLKRLRMAALALAAATLWGSAGCSYLKWRQERSEGLAELKKEPSLVLEKEVLPENCFVLAGEELSFVLDAACDAGAGK